MIWNKSLTEELESCVEEKKELYQQCRKANKQKKAKKKSIDDNPENIEKILGVKFMKSHFYQINWNCDEKELDYCECSCIPIKRISAILNIYHKWFHIKDKVNFHEFSGNMHGFINHFLTQYESRLHCAYSNVALLNDFHHILKEHELGYVLPYIKQDMRCNIDNCQIIKRHYRDKSLCIEDNELRSSHYFGFGKNSKEVNTQNILDNIHCYIFHSYDTLKCSPHEIHQLQSHEDIMDDDDQKKTAKAVVDLNAMQLTQIKSILSRKQTQMRRILGVDQFRLQSSKFRTDIEGKEKSYGFGRTRNNKSYDPNVIYIGDRLYYWRQYQHSDNQQFYICPKYKSLKEEIRSNLVHPLSKLQWTDTVLRASNLIECEQGKKLISYYGWKNKQYQKHWVQNYNINVDKSINQSHLIAVLLYCNFTSLHYHFIRTFNQKKKSLASKTVPLQNRHKQYMNGWKNTHSEFGHLARLLREITEVYGQEIGSNDDMKYQDECASYYHLVKSQYLFKNTVCKFNNTLSTSNQLSVGIIYSSNAPLLLNLTKYGDIGCYHFDCDWLSDFCNESECLFTGSYCLEIQSIIHIDRAHNYGIYIGAIRIINRLINGNASNVRLISRECQQALKILIEIESMKSQYVQHIADDEKNDVIDRGQNHKRKQKLNIPPYIQCLFHYQCLNVVEINFDTNVLFHVYGDNSNMFISDNWIDIDIFIDLYPNVECIKINLQSKIEMNLASYQKLTNVLKKIQSISEEKVD